MMRPAQVFEQLQPLPIQRVLFDKVSTPVLVSPRMLEAFGTRYVFPRSATEDAIGLRDCDANMVSKVFGRHALVHIVA